MRKVTRTAKPQSLIDHAEQWTKELLDEIDKKGSYDKVSSTFKDKYRQDDIKDALETMYSGHCCYCESILGISTYGRIEHLKPKSLPQFHRYSFDWNNLHWCCEVCNTSYKRTNWNFRNPILDPSVDDISQYLELDLQTGEYKEIGNNPRATTTINHTGINRDGLVKSRRRHIIRFIKDYKLHKAAGKEDDFLSLWKNIKDDYAYPTMYQTLITQLSQA